MLQKESKILKKRERDNSIIKNIIHFEKNVGYKVNFGNVSKSRQNKQT